MSPRPETPSIARTPDPPYYVVIFTSRRTGRDAEGYDRMAAAMADLAARQPGFLGIESVREPGGVGITVSYWESETAIHAWKRVAAHREAQREGRAAWYEDYALRVARVERAYTLSTSTAEGIFETG